LLEEAIVLVGFEGYSPGPMFEEGTLVPLSIWVKIYLVYFNLLAIYAFLLSKAVANGYSLLYPFRLM
jgi:hypothetical protein